MNEIDVGEQYFVNLSQHYPNPICLKILVNFGPELVTHAAISDLSKIEKL